jgi:hypothetical protein
MRFIRGLITPYSGTIAIEPARAPPARGPLLAASMWAWISASLRRWPAAAEGEDVEMAAQAEIPGRSPMDGPGPLAIRCWKRSLSGSNEKDLRAPHRRGAQRPLVLIRLVRAALATEGTDRGPI